MTPTPTGTFTLTPLPTYINLRGEVIVEQAVCHYGPGAPYLYKYGVYLGSNLEIIARVERGNYLEVQAIGGNNPCWVKADYLKVKGNILDLKPINAEAIQLPLSPYYNPPTGVSARREGETVFINWQSVELKAGDDSEQIPYLVESWVCQKGELAFYPVGSYKTSVSIIDEAGCSQPSYARLMAAEKHGYTKWVPIPWPAVIDEIRVELSPVP